MTSRRHVPADGLHWAAGPGGGRRALARPLHHQTGADVLASRLQLTLATLQGRYSTTVHSGLTLLRCRCSPMMHGSASWMHRCRSTWPTEISMVSTLPAGLRTEGAVV